MVDFSWPSFGTHDTHSWCRAPNEISIRPEQCRQISKLPPLVWYLTCMVTGPISDDLGERFKSEMVQVRSSMQRLMRTLGLYI